MVVPCRQETAAGKRSRGAARVASLAVTAALIVAACGGGSGGDDEPLQDASAPATGEAAPVPAVTAATTSTTTTTASSTEPATTSTTATTASATEPATPSTTAAPTTTAAASATVSATTTAPPTTTVPAPTTTVPAPAASTIDELLALDRPVVIAHAGGDQDYPHSTVYAYSQAAAAGADVLELDVQLTADGVLIVQHDDTVDRTTEASGPVAELTLAEIQALDNAYWFVAGLWGDQTRPDDEYVWRGVRTGEVEPPPGFEADDFRVPTFREVAERFPHYVLDVEIKLQRGSDGEDDPAAGIAAAAVLAEEIAELGREDSVIVASFNDEVLDAFAAMAPSVLISPGLEAMLGWYLADQPLDPSYRVLQAPFTYEGVEVVQPDVVDKVHREGRHLWVWLSGTDVLETQEFYADLLSRGVDGVIAGRPALAAAALTEARGAS